MSNPHSIETPLGKASRCNSLTRLLHGFLMIGLVWTTATHAGQGRYLEVDEFLDVAFQGAEPRPATLWIDHSLRTTVQELLGHSFSALRVRYWQHDGKSAWIFDEIGKEQPITIGITVVGGAVDIVRVLEFREPRGWEVRHPFFTDQFAGARAVAQGTFDRSIDGITGATLSVAAVTRAVKLALLLSEQAQHQPS